MFLGLNIGHDAGVAVTNKSGKVLHAISEERISRTKIHAGIPIESIKLLSEIYDLDKIENVVIGNNQNLDSELLRRILADLENSTVRKRGLNLRVPPGSRIPIKPEIVRQSFFSELFKLIGDKKNILLTKHHDSHLGCAIGIANYGKSALLLSLDGTGDGESGAISSIRGNSPGLFHRYQEHARFPTLDSFGLLYNAVTKAYNFKPLHHDGKITGLAAYGGHSSAVDVLLKYVSVIEGIPTIKQARDLKDRFLSKSLKQIGLTRFAKKNLDEIVSIAEASTVNYPDLAFAIQDVLEQSVIEIVRFWQQKLNCETLALTGGVFANVKLNQKLSELELFEDLRIFPNMGDGGIPLGGIWFELYKRGELSKSPLFENMFLAPDISDKDKTFFSEIKNKSNLHIEKIKKDNLPALIALCLFKGEIGALHKGRMEFGPRALCNRTILADPRDKLVNKSINDRLHRTEFMPFAPVVKSENFFKYFEISKNQTLFPFKYMTMTCRVKDEFAKKFPGVVHIDQTARPQIIESTDDRFTWEILNEFEKLTGVGVLVNTSFNVHEEPINFKLQDSIEALERNAVDFLIYEDHIIRIKK
jgi:carbamoyltransferase